jgi:hypothetical protein
LSAASDLAFDFVLILFLFLILFLILPKLTSTNLHSPTRPSVPSLRLAHFRPAHHAG